jgi:hypothetical protein
MRGAWMLGCLLGVCLSGSVWAAGKLSTPEVRQDIRGFNLVSVDTMWFAWKVSSSEVSQSVTTSAQPTMIQCEVEAPTTGWVAVGFNNRPKMDRANFIIGFVKDQKAEVFDHIARGHGHRADKINNLLAFGGEEKDGRTKLSFSIPLNNDANGEDYALVPGQNVVVLLAHGNQDKPAGYHKKYTFFEIKL